jgi:hypothetical protein
MTSSEGPLPSTAAGSNRFIVASENGTKIKGKSNPTAVTISRPDILGTNGIVHVNRRSTKTLTLYFILFEMPVI